MNCFAGHSSLLLRLACWFLGYEIAQMPLHTWHYLKIYVLAKVILTELVGR